jgi:hypothetical protein
MSRSAGISASPALRGVLGWALANPHFMIAVLMVIVTAAFALREWPQPEPVPWPDKVQVDEKFRMTSLPTELGGGHYVLASDRDLEVSDYDLRSLKIGTSLDKERRSQRRSNWYAVGVYRDTRAEEQSPYRDWHLAVYYYTGVGDKVPHVPERCQVAGGAMNVVSENVPFAVGDSGSTWPAEIELCRVRYEKEGGFATDRYQGVEYYIFSLNGRPENSWKQVRFELSLPWQKYCYFAKIQFSPARGVTDVRQADKKAEEFLRDCLPEVLKLLPTPADIERLKAAGKADTGG